MKKQMKNQQKRLVFWLLAIFSAFLPACVTTATWLEKTYHPQKKGRLFYDPTPAPFNSSIVEERRQDAQMKMSSFCAPQTPSILKEVSKEEVLGVRTRHSGAATNPAASHASRSDYIKDYGKNYGSAAFSSQSATTAPKELRSESTVTTSNITRDRVYIDFVCK